MRKTMFVLFGALVLAGCGARNYYETELNYYQDGDIIKQRLYSCPRFEVKHMETESESSLGKHGLLHMLWGSAFSRRGNQQSLLFSIFLEKSSGYPTRCPRGGSIVLQNS